MSVINSLANDKILAKSKMRAFLDDILNVSQNIKSVFHRVENIVGKGEMLAPAFSPFPTMFLQGFLLKAFKSCH